ncbi:protein LAZ1 [Tanacetum coccineum]
MCNLHFNHEYPGSYAIFQPYRISDHSLAVLKIHKISKEKPKPFKFFNFLTYKPEFMKVVNEHWNVNVNGYNMFKLVKKMKLLKKPMRKLMHSQGNIHDRVDRLRHELDEVQIALDKDPSSVDLREEEAAYLTAFNKAILDEERFLKQKAKIEWLREGDGNSAYFHRSVNARVSRSHIDCITDQNNVVHERNSVPILFVDHYTNFLGVEGPVSDMDTEGLFNKRLIQHKADNMVRGVLDSKIRCAMFLIGNDKAPSPDGFTLIFFKKAWDVVGFEVCNAVRDFFTNGKLLQEINHTILALLPKVSTPTLVNDFRPISCCNVIYKCISKIITNRIKDGLDDVVSDNQSAFVSGQSISDNILLTQKLMHNYHLDRGPSKCAFKIHIQKAYDTVSWNFLENILVGFGFHQTLIKWAMACVTSTTFSINVNGNLHGYFKGKCGLRQGDPMSPYLFTLVIEILTLILKRRVREDDGFIYLN